MTTIAMLLVFIVQFVFEGFRLRFNSSVVMHFDTNCDFAIVFFVVLIEVVELNLVIFNGKIILKFINQFSI